jgi:hypothetical protein
MRLSTILTLLLFTVTALSITPRGNSCFGDAKTYCSGHDADPGNATMAITNACAKIGSCTPGVAANRPKETGMCIAFALLFISLWFSGPRSACLANHPDLWLRVRLTEPTKQVSSTGGHTPQS